jgi:hypothetical protein
MPVLNLNTAGNEKEFPNQIVKLPLTKSGKTDLKRDAMTLITAAVQKINITVTTSAYHSRRCSRL